MPSRAETIASYESQIGELQRQIDVMQLRGSELQPGADDDRITADNDFILKTRQEIARLKKLLEAVRGKTD